MYNSFWIFIKIFVIIITTRLTIVLDLFSKDTALQPV